MRLRTIVFALAIIFFPYWATRTEACSCRFGGAAPCEEYWEADVVFSGTVVGSTRIEVDRGSYQATERSVKFTVGQPFRGSTASEIEVRTGLGGGDCGYGFKTGESYMVYAYRASDGKLYTGICSRTRALSEAREDLAFIQTLGSAEETGTIFGEVTKQNWQPKEDEKYSKPVADAELIIEGEHVREETKSDEHGKFRFTGLKAGSYKVKLKLPPGLLRNSLVRDQGMAIVENEVSVKARGCAETDFYLESDTRLAGRVIGSSDQPVGQITLDLRGANKDNSNINIFRSTVSNPAGQFEFTVVPPGDYLLGVRLLSSQHTASLPYPRTYYPGVSTRAQAVVITVKEGARIGEIELRLPPPLNSYQVAGIAVWADGRPAPGVSIYVTRMDEGRGDSMNTLRADERGNFTLEVFDGLSYSASAFAENGGRPGVQSPWIEVPSRHGPRPLKLVLPLPARK